ncbi:hypothetical protein [Fusobacterium sp. FSA-380-WT-2B]|uniref:hypothetical protein n=1 Tax=Fusobacterium sp. FSA-380-WT-2B TaxID=2605786 RepID=UPI0012B1F34D|nr:hypothetical protein [Fusobacterium sp. FSA-380-WT-2B]MSS61465.1 hypothetical protein [Fusobacterium sp. FSA-380-WT-2B]
MKFLFYYILSFLLMKYILNMSVIDIFMLQGFVSLIFFICITMIGMRKFLDDYKKNSDKILGKDKKIFDNVPFFNGGELITYIIVTIIVFIVLLKMFPISRPILEVMYSWEIPLRKIIPIFDYVNRFGLSLGIIVIIGYINYVFKLNKESENYNIVSDKFIYYLKYTFINFLIHLSQIFIIIVAPFLFKLMRF